MTDRYLPLPGYRAWPDTLWEQVKPWLAPALVVVAAALMIWFGNHLGGSAQNSHTEGKPYESSTILLIVAALFLMGTGLIGGVIFAIKTLLQMWSMFGAWRRSRGIYLARERRDFRTFLEGNVTVNRARATAYRIARREPISGFTPESPFLVPGEFALADHPAEYGRFYATNVTPKQTSMFAFGSPLFIMAAIGTSLLLRAARAESASKEARAQWRELQVNRSVVTNKRVLYCVGGHEWVSFWYKNVAEIIPLLEQQAILVRFHGGAPLRLVGASAPMAAVMMVAAQTRGNVLSHSGLRQWLESPDILDANSLRLAGSTARAVTA